LPPPKVRGKVPDTFFFPRDVLNAAGAVVDTIKYDGFGNLTSEISAAAGGRFLFQGENQHRDLFTFQADARVDKTTIGHWIQEDPIVFRAGDANLYRLVSNNPTNATDPTGLKLNDRARIGDRLVSWLSALRYPL
jgi:RHS repeat-associated protein